ncbi:MAG: FAD-binding protein [Clostridia bacterium]|nr:FAD-binding protein [Clostridia bacterium]
MIIRQDNVKLNISESESRLVDIAKRKLKRQPKYFKILKKSLDARDKNNMHWVYSIAFSADEERENKPPLKKVTNPPVVCVVGSGPAGLCCAVRLADRGFHPIVIERGGDVDSRSAAVDLFCTQKVLNENCNVQFGEGGAGTFSDGKLNTQTHDGYNRDVLETFYRFGAPEEILYYNKPHIGSDKLKGVVKAMRQYIISCGGKFLFDTVFTGFVQRDGTLKSVIVKNVLTGQESEIITDIAVLALGHSARDTFKMLNKNGVYMQPRDFAVGVRIEHLASEINRAQYGSAAHLLPAADYKLVSHAHERTVFTFCMCPGGVVIPAASEQGGVVVNGMSNYDRGGVNSNSALMVQLKKQDFGEGLFDGMDFQRKIEQAAYRIAGSNYSAPCQLYGDFASGRVSDKFGEVSPSYAAGTTFAPLDMVLPEVATDALRAAIPDMDRRLKGFANPYAVMTGVESRFSSPVRIERGSDLQSVSVKGLYPCGEGSGYSGGITSSAADGIKVADFICGLHINS